MFVFLNFRVCKESLKFSQLSVPSLNLHYKKTNKKRQIGKQRIVNGVVTCDIAVLPRVDSFFGPS